MKKNKNILVNKSLIKRLAVIDREISALRYPNKERLAKHLCVSTKTIQRDIEFMKHHYDAPIGFDKQRRGFYYTDSGFAMNPLEITESDFLAVAVTEKILKQYQNTPYANYFRTFFEKFSNIYNGKLSVDIKDIDKIISFSLNPVRNIPPHIMGSVREALQDNRRINVKYLTGHSGRESERLIDIYHLRNYNGDWYAIAYCHKANGIRVFAVSRFKSISLTNRHYTIPDNFDIEKYFENSFGIFESPRSHSVKLKVTGDMVRYVTERKWHKSERLTRLPDGSITLEYTVNDLNEIKFWALSMGEFCEILEPETLRSEIKSTLKKSLSHYK